MLEKEDENGDWKMTWRTKNRPKKKWRETKRQKNTRVTVLILPHAFGWRRWWWRALTNPGAHHLRWRDRTRLSTELLHKISQSDRQRRWIEGVGSQPPLAIVLLVHAVAPHTQVRLPIRCPATRTEDGLRRTQRHPVNPVPPELLVSRR